MKTPIFHALSSMQKCRIKVFVSPNQNIVVGTKRNRLNETVLLSTQNKYLIDGQEYRYSFIFLKFPSLVLKRSLTFIQ